MSHHILHQFDEPWSSPAGRAGVEQTGRLLNAPSRHNVEIKARLRLVVLGRRVFWITTLAAVVIAAAALLFALDARHRADVLHQRLSALEKQKL